jgi:KaiC/GvpD/RAD55 family RecA-like ATPase
MLPPAWLRDADPSVRPIQLDCSLEEALEYNNEGMNVYYYPNYPSIPPKTWVQAPDVDIFEWVFCDMDLKEGVWESKEAFIAELLQNPLEPTRIVDSGGGIHAYYRVSDLDAKGFLKLSRRIARLFKTDLAVQQLKQLMRVPGTINTKDPENLKTCEEIYTSEAVYTSEQLDRLIPALTQEDADYCRDHYDRAHNKESTTKVDETLPPKFGQLLRTSQEVRDIWTGQIDDRSKGDWRLGHIMYGSGFTRQEAMSVLVNSAKALSRAPMHRIGYAEGIVDKIYTHEADPTQSELTLSSTVAEVLSKFGTDLKGHRFPCAKYLDNTLHGFRLGQVIGLVAGSGVGKTAMALNMFMNFVELNQDYDHIFVPLEQPVNEIADRWKAMCGEKTHLHNKVHLISNYDDNGNFRHLSLEEIKNYILKLQEIKKIKIGCVVIDHIGALKKKGKNGENQDLMDVCHSMKAFAVQTNSMLVMQSQAPREKAGIGDLELNKDAAYGTVYFESYCDYLITLWQPLKRCYSSTDCPTVMAFKFCKIRHKKQGKDVIQEDVPYALFFDPVSEQLRELTEVEENSFKFFARQAANKRKQDRKTEVVSYTSVKMEEGQHGNVNHSQNAVTAKGA